MTRTLWLAAVALSGALAGCACTDAPAPAAAPSEPAAGGAPPELAGVERALDVDEVWSGHPVGFALVTSDRWQFAAYYDAERNMTVASRRLSESSWNKTTLPSRLGWDSHNNVVLAVDALGILHVSGNMHDAPLVYFRSTRAYDIDSFERLDRMVGSNEASVTYPKFATGVDAELIFSYRDGSSGDGNNVFNRYDAERGTWSRLLDTPLTDGEGVYNAYLEGPVRGPDGYWHLVWVWRDTPDAATNHDLCYARSSNLTTWESASGVPLELPITLGTSEIVDPVPAGGGIINNNTRVGFDADKRPVVAYHKFDENGFTQLYNARYEAGRWVSHRTSDWTYRWDFGGGGSLGSEIRVFGVDVTEDGSLVQRYYHAKYGGDGAFLLDPVTLRAKAQIEPELPYPPELEEPRSPTPGMETRWKSSWGRPVGSGRHFLRWETLPSNRDMARDTIPPPTPLELFVFADP